MENYARCIEILKKKLECKDNAEDKYMLMKFLGIASFNLYSYKRYSHPFTVKADSKVSSEMATCFEYAKDTVKYLGSLYDEITSLMIALKLGFLILYCMI